VQDRNQIGDMGACGLRDGLKVNSSLKHLELVGPLSLCWLLFFCLRRRCGRGREGAGAALTLVLQDNNDIGDEGACALGDGLKANSSLLYLALVRLFSAFSFL